MCESHGGTWHLSCWPQKNLGPIKLSLLNIWAPLFRRCTPSFLPLKQRFSNLSADCPGGLVKKHTSIQQFWAGPQTVFLTAPEGARRCWSVPLCGSAAPHVSAHAHAQSLRDPETTLQYSRAPLMGSPRFQSWLSTRTLP